MPDLAKRYRRLLFCYPRAYRHVRGEEIVETFLELAPADRTRPTLREAVNLIVQGLRCRLGRHDSRTVVAWSILTAVIVGCYAGMATWVSYGPDRPPPDLINDSHVLTQAVGADEMLGQYNDTVYMSVPDNGPWSAERLADVADRLHSLGWTVEDRRHCAGSGCGYTSEAILVASMDGEVMELSHTMTGDEGELVVSFHRERPFTDFVPSIAVGMLAATIGWLLFGWSSRRTAYRGARRIPLLTSYFLAMLLWWYPVFWGAYHLLRDDWRLAGHRYAAYESQEAWGLLTMLFFIPFGGLLFAMALAIAALPQPRRDATPIMS